ncbi:MAG: hypothetical protein SF187_25860 [Deltaproteobacteria bacterium]|nr:hypothetical protein [Deltaproteobacteria bacterium]
MREQVGKGKRGSTALMNSPRKTWDEVQQYVRKEVEENPIRTTLIGVGVGYVLGGGLFSSLTARVLGTATRFALRAVSLPVIVRGGMELGGQLFAQNGRQREPATE